MKNLCEQRHAGFYSHVSLWILYCKYVGRDFWIVDADGSEIEGKTF